MLQLQQGQINHKGIDKLNQFCHPQASPGFHDVGRLLGANTGITKQLGQTRDQGTEVPSGSKSKTLKKKINLLL